MPSLKHSITIIAGHYGSGKTEFAVNLAFSLAKAEKPVSLVDLDIVNPYFCSREREAQLNAANITLIAPSRACQNADVPALPAEVSRIFADDGGCSVLDVGGDDAGAKVLSQYLPRFRARGYELWIVVNANRPQTADVDSALGYLRRIEAASRLTATGIVNNTHLCAQTGIDDILRGSAMARELAKKSGLPLVCSTVPRALLDECRAAGIAEELFPIDIYMKKPWEC